MAPSNKATWILEKRESSFEEFNELAETLFPKEEGDDKLLLHPDFSFAILSRYIRSVPTAKPDGTVARRFVVWFRMYLQTKQNITQANTPTDRRFTLADIESKLGVSDLTEWVPPFAFRTSDPDPYTIVHGVYGGGDKTFCVGTLRTKGHNKNPPKKNEVIEIDLDLLPPGADEASYDGITQPYKKENSQFSSPRKKTIKVEKTQKSSSDVLEELPLFMKSKRTAAKKATKQIVKQKVEDEKIDQGEDEFIVQSDSTLSNERVVVKFKSGTKKQSPSSDSSDTSTSSSSDSSDSDSSGEDRKKKRKRKRSKDKRRRKREKEGKSSKKRDTLDSPSKPGFVNRDTHMATITTNSPERKNTSPKMDTVFSRTCCNKDCKITEKYTPVNYGCNTCHGICHWDCLHDAHTCISCSTAADPTGTESAGPAVALVEPPPTGIKPAESAVAVVDPPSATPVKTDVGEEKKPVNPLDDQGGPNIYGNLAYASVEELQMALAKRIQLDQQKDTTDTVMVAPTQGGETEQ